MNLTRDVCKNKKQLTFDFNEQICRIFQKLKKQFSSTSMLIHHDPRQRICIELNASDFTIAAIFAELCDDELWHLIAYYSQKMTDIETCYEMHDRKLLSIYVAFKQ